MAHSSKYQRRGTVLLMVVGLLSMLFVMLSAYIMLARHDSQIQAAVREGQNVDDIVDGVNDLILSEIENQILDPTGVGSYELIPGYGKSSYLASTTAEIRPWRQYFEDDDGPDMASGGKLWNTGSIRGNDKELLRVYYPAVSRLGGAGEPGMQPLFALLKNHGSHDENVTHEVREADLVANAREAYMDADGDGIPDALLYGAGSASSYANMMAGTPVQTPDAGQQDFSKDDESDYLAWQRHNETARYETAVRVVSHGGMVQFSAGDPNTAPTAWFTRSMYGWLTDADEDLDLSDPDDGGDKARFFRALAAQSPQVEAELRHRGGLVYASSDDAKDAGLCPVLRELLVKEDMVDLFAPGHRSSGPKYADTQRYDLSTDGRKWTEAAAINSADYNREGNDKGLVEDFNKRQLLTTVSYSDDTARRLDQRDPDISGGSIASGVNGLRLFEGELKFYLGDVTRPSPFSASAAAPVFDPATGSFNADEGKAVIGRLARYYYDMLSGHAGWADEATPTEAVTREQQAYMLAVNTVAFAAPYVADSTDVVSFVDPGDPTTVYYGYVPQPFLTQAAVHVIDVNGAENERTLYYALAFELYNPHDRPLSLAQYGIKINDIPTGTAYGLTAGTGFDIQTNINAYGFAGIVMYESAGGFDGNFVLANLSDPNSAAWASDKLTVLPSELERLSYPLRVELWRLDGGGAPLYLADAIEVQKRPETPDFVMSGSATSRQQTWEGTFRDTSSLPYLGTIGGLPARWGMVTALPPSTAYANTDAGGADSTSDQSIINLRRSFGAAGPDPAVAPPVPLYTMNAQMDGNNPPFVDGYIAMHNPSDPGDYRPASFPTVGFLAFVPRFSHAYRSYYDGTTHSKVPADYVSMGETLRSQWEDYRKYTTAGGTPLDFGHMPFFDNTQKVAPSTTAAGAYFNEAGLIPWGQLIFDYFTTTCPDLVLPGVDENYGQVEDNIKMDPYAIPGRININTAPWYVLAGLPLINAQWLTNAQAAPAFWNEGVQVFVGNHPDSAPPGNFRFRSPGSTGAAQYDADDDDPKIVTHIWGGDGTYEDCFRVGAHLGQAIAAYRDRVSNDYETPAGETFSNPYIYAEERNGGPSVLYRNEAVYEKIRRGTAGTDPAYGLLTIGELLNVKGGDTTEFWPDGSLRFDHVLSEGDFMKAVSLIAQLDTHYLTTRSNTFTSYVTLYDREQPQSSVRSQVTFDRGSLLPRLVTNPDHTPKLEDVDGTWKPVRIDNSSQKPRVIAQQRDSYYDTSFGK